MKTLICVTHEKIELLFIDCEYCFAIVLNSVNNCLINQETFRVDNMQLPSNILKNLMSLYSLFPSRAHFVITMRLDWFHLNMTHKTAIMLALYRLTNYMSTIMGKKISKWPGSYHKGVIGQTGFKLKHSIRDHHIITIHVIMEERLSARYCQFLCLKKQFSIVPRTGLGEHMTKTWYI